VATAFVTPNYFTEFGIPGLSGRLLSSTIDEAAAAEPVALLGQGFWERRLGGEEHSIRNRQVFGSNQKTPVWYSSCD
jgi:hypothetical protein